MKRKRKESGAIAIETILSLTFFMVAVIAIMMVSMIIRTQAAMQHALNQTAKEISGYFYLLDRIGIVDFVTGEVTGDVDEALKKSDDAIARIVNFSSETKQSVENIKNNLDKKPSLDTITSTADDVKAINANIESLGNYLYKIAKDGTPQDLLKAVINVFGKTAANKAFSSCIGGVLCKGLMPKYLTSGDINEYFENVGITSVTYSQSELISDGRSINLVVIYKMDISKATLGLVHKELYFRQVASTAAWVRPNKTGSVPNLSKISAKMNDIKTQKEKAEQQKNETPEVTGIVTSDAVTSEVTDVSAEVTKAESDEKTSSVTSPVTSVEFSEPVSVETSVLNEKKEGES